MAIGALDENGKAVDWWFIYKVPKLVQSPTSDSATGYEYVYFDANASEVKRSPYRLDQGKGALNVTLASVFKSPKSTGWILYNDEKPPQAPGADDGNCGHTKGALAYDVQSNTAVWLVHSWPKYVAPAQSQAPTPMYGQTYLCLSLKLSTATKIVAQMKQDYEPQVFLPRQSAPAGNAAFAALVGAGDAPRPANASNVAYKTAGGMSFRVLAKNREWNDDFWNDWVGPQLQQDIDVETWIRGPVPPVVDSDGIHKTFDIKYINLGPLGVHLAWPETRDHAKWAITKEGNWVCVGDINRMISQRKRGGGTVAFQSPKLWQALSRTDLLLAPPGHTRDEARAMIQQTHIDPDAPRPPRVKARAAARARQ